MTTHPLHEKALKLAQTLRESERHLIEVLEEIDSQKIWRFLGYSSFFEYGKSALGLSESQTYLLTSVSRKCIELPELKTAIVMKKISISNAKRILPVLTQDNQSDWIEKAEKLSTRALEREVATLSPRTRIQETIKPFGPSLSKMTLCLSETNEVLFRKAQDLLAKKNRRNLNLEETVTAMAKFVIYHLDKVDKAERIARKELDNVQKAERILRKECAQSMGIKAGQSHGSLSTSKRYRPQTIEHQVSLRDRGECQSRLPDGTLCKKTRFVEIHHIVPLSRGGTHEVSNLITLCSAHHKQRHLDMPVTSGEGTYTMLDHIH